MFVNLNNFVCVGMVVLSDHTSKKAPNKVPFPSYSVVLLERLYVVIFKGRNDCYNNYTTKNSV